MRTVRVRTMPAVLAGAALLMAAPGASAGGDPFAGRAAVAAGDLASQRGGMMIGDIPVDFAVVVKTTVSDATDRPTVLETTLNPAAGPVAATVTAALGQATQVVQQISPGQLQTLVSNAANGVSIDHSTTINARLPTIRQASQQFAARLQAAGLAVDAALSGLRR